MLDAQGFRPNVGIVIANDAGRLLWARRVGGRDSWQFPQGGINDGEKPEDALYRELKEEVGLDPEAVEILASTRGWLRYRLPRRFQRKGQSPLCVGQKQKWYLLRLLADDGAVNLSDCDKPEFDHWQWVSYWYPLNQVVYFKREVYRRALRELAPPLVSRIDDAP
jgi:putative (di)nucleoside polyphosphate hydrolase